jgi:hypothetical protein
LSAETVTGADDESVVAIEVLQSTQNVSHFDILDQWSQSYVRPLHLHI